MDKTLKQGGPRVSICSYKTSKISTYALDSSLSTIKKKKPTCLCE